MIPLSFKKIANDSGNKDRVLSKVSLYGFTSDELVEPFLVSLENFAGEITNMGPEKMVWMLGSINGWEATEQWIDSIARQLGKKIKDTNKIYIEGPTDIQ